MNSRLSKLLACAAAIILLCQSSSHADVMATIQADRTFGPNGSYQFEVTSFTGSPGINPGWDFLVLTGSGLNITATPANPFTIDLTSLTPAQTNGPLNSFDENSVISVEMVSSPNGISGFDPDAFIVSTANFQNPFVGSFNVGLQSGNPNALVLNYDPTPVASIPEPSTWAMMLLGTLFLGLCRVRRKKKAESLAASCD